MSLRSLCVPVAIAAVVATGALASTAVAAPPVTSLHVVTLNGFQIGARRWLGLPPAQVIAAYGRPTARIVRPTTLDLRYGTWTIHFQRRSSDGHLLAASAVSTDPALYGNHGNRLLAPWFGLRGIEGAIAREVEWTRGGDFNDWIKRPGSFVGADFPRTITWGIDAHGRRWLRVATDLDVEFRGP